MRYVKVETTATLDAGKDSEHTIDVFATFDTGAVVYHCTMKDISHNCRDLPPFDHLDADSRHAILTAAWAEFERIEARKERAMREAMDLEDRWG